MNLFQKIIFKQIKKQVIQIGFSVNVSKQRLMQSKLLQINLTSHHSRGYMIGYKYIKNDSFIKTFFPFLLTPFKKLIQVSGARFYNTSSGQGIVCSPPQAKSPSLTIYPAGTLPLPPPQQVIITLLSMSFFSLFFPICSIPLFSHPALP